MPVNNDTERLKLLGLKIDGLDAAPELLKLVTEVEVQKHLEAPDTFIIRIAVGAADTEGIEAADAIAGETLGPGTEVEISHRLGSRESILLSGIVTTTGLDVSSSARKGTVIAVIRGHDLSYRLYTEQRTATFLEMKYSDVAAAVGSEVGLGARTDETAETFDYVIQANQTHWEFLQQLADRVGYVLYVENGTLHFEASTSREKIELKWGKGLVKFQGQANIADQSYQATVRGWDPGDKAAIVGTSIIKPTLRRSVARRLGTDIASVEMVDQPVRTDLEADTIAGTLAVDSRRSELRSEGLVTPGLPAIAPGATIAISGLGQHMNREYFVTGSTHRLSVAEGYETAFRAGITEADPPSSASSNRLHALSAHSLKGAVVGVVTNNDDPGGLGRVKVKFPWLGDNVESDWARVAAPGAGKDRGMCWRPEVEDEVLIIFEQGDIRRPYALGGLWNGKDEPPSKAIGDDKNDHRILKSRSGMVLEFNDENNNRSVKLAGPADNSRFAVHVDDKYVEIVSEDKIVVTNAKTKIEFDRKNLLITSDGNISIDAKGDLELKSEGTVTIDAGNDVIVNAGRTCGMQGTNAKVEADATVTVKGSQANLEGSATTTVKGGLVLIN